MYMLMIDTGLSLTSFSSYYYTFRNFMTFIPLTDPGSKRDICLSWDGGKYIQKASKVYRDFCVEFFKDLQKKQDVFLAERGL